MMQVRVGSLAEFLTSSDHGLTRFTSDHSVYMFELQLSHHKVIRVYLNISHTFVMSEKTVTLTGWTRNNNVYLQMTK